MEKRDSIPQIEFINGYSIESHKLLHDCLLAIVASTRLYDNRYIARTTISLFAFNVHVLELTYACIQTVDSDVTNLNDYATSVEWFPEIKLGIIKIKDMLKGRCS